MRNLVLAIALAALTAPALVIGTPAQAHEVIDAWGHHYWQPDETGPEDIIGGIAHAIIPHGHHERHGYRDRRHEWDHDRWMHGGYRGRHWHHDEEEGD